LQEHDQIMADEKFTEKTVKKNIFPRLLDKTAWTGEQVPLKEFRKCKNNEFEKFRRSGTLRVRFIKKILDWILKSESGFRVSILNRLIQYLSDLGASKEPFSDSSFGFKNPILYFLKETHSKLFKSVTSKVAYGKLM